MHRKLIEHSLSVTFFAILFSVIGFTIALPPDSHQISREVAIYYDFINPDDPLHKLMLKESLDLYYPMQSARNDSIVHKISDGSVHRFSQHIDNKALTSEKTVKIIYMYLKFIIIYVFVLILTYFGAQSLAIFKFIKMRQKRSSYLTLLWNHLHSTSHISAKIIFISIIKACIKGFIYLVLFSPAYVIAYSFKTRFDTDSIFFLVLLGIISNGLLISYTQKFYTYLVTESRKGYVNTARVKNLNNSYDAKRPDGIRYGKIFRLRKSFDGHVFQHIFKNARFQFISSIKEQASFLISGLVIIEMALNIQGHLCYELLQNILYENFQAVLLIVFLIFLLLKLTEVYCDYLQHHYSSKYENIA